MSFSELSFIKLELAIDFSEWRELPQLYDSTVTQGVSSIVSLRAQAVMACPRRYWLLRNRDCERRHDKTDSSYYRKDRSTWNTVYVKC